MLAAALALGGCGGSGSAAGRDGGQGPYFNMSKLGEALRQRLAREHPNTIVQEVVCGNRHGQVAECNVTEDEQGTAYKVQIAADGRSFAVR